MDVRCAPTSLGAIPARWPWSAAVGALVRVVDDHSGCAIGSPTTADDYSGRWPNPPSLLQDCARIPAYIPARRSRIHPGLAQEASDDLLRSVAMNSYRSDIVDIPAEPNDAAAVALGRTLLTRRTMGCAAVGVTGRIVIAAAAADARPVWARRSE